MNILLQRKIEVNQWIIKARWLYVLGILLIGFVTKLFSNTNVNFSRTSMIILAVLILGANILLFYFNKIAAQKHSLLRANLTGAAQILVELAVLTIVMHNAGGVDSISYIYFFLPIFSSALIFGITGSIATALLSAVLFNGLIVFEYWGWFPHINRYSAATLEFQSLSLSFTKSFTISIFYIISSLFAGYSAKLLRTKEEQLIKKTLETVRINKELDKKIVELKKSERSTLKAFIDLKRQREITDVERNKTAAIISNFLDPIIVIDHRHKINFLNPAAKEVLGFRDTDIGEKISKSENYSMKNFSKLLGDGYSVKSYKDLKSSDRNIEELTINQGDQENIYKVNTIQVRDELGVYLGTMKIFHNMTREKMLDKLKSDFISIAAHQLRTPLSAIKWAIKMVLDGDAGKLNKEQELILNKGYSSNERVIHLINDMLDVSRIEEGRFAYQFTDTDISEVLNTALINFDKKVSSKSLILTINKPKELPRVYIDKDKVTMVVKNLLENAVEYTPENGKIDIDIEVGKELLKFSIKDNGVGVPEADKPKVFSKFYRGGNVMRMQTDGSGLGLFITKNVIKKHGGDITFTSEEGKGSEFIFTLPLKRKGQS